MNRRQNPGSCRQAAAAAPVYLSRTYLLLNLQFLRNLIETSEKIYFHARNCLIRMMTKMDWAESSIRLVVALCSLRKEFYFYYFIGFTTNPILFEYGSIFIIYLSSADRGEVGEKRLDAK